MGFGISRRVRSFRNDILLKVKKFNLPLYRFLIFLGAYFKFINKIFKKKTYKRYSINLDEINKYEYKKTSQNNEDGIIEFIFSISPLNEFMFLAEKIVILIDSFLAIFIAFSISSLTSFLE